MLMMTEMKTDEFHAQVLVPQDRAALERLCGGGMPFVTDLAPLLQTGAVLGDYSGGSALLAAAALLPMYGESRLTLALRAAGFGADGQGVVLTPPCFAAGYQPVRRFLVRALGWAQQRCASYHVWAALVLRPGRPCERLCASYLASGLTLRAVLPLDASQLLIFAAHAPCSHGRPLRRVRLHDPALPRLLDRGTVADFAWEQGELLVSVRG